MKKLVGFGIICFCLLLGVITKNLINYPIPEAVYGMAYLLMALLLGIVKVKNVEDAGNLLLENLAFLFVLPGLALINQLDSLKNVLIPILIICILSTIIGMIATSKTVQVIQKWRKKNDR